MQNDDHRLVAAFDPWSSWWFTDTNVIGGMQQVPTSVVKHYSAFEAEVKYCLGLHYRSRLTGYRIRRHTIDYDDGGDHQKLQRLLSVLAAAVDCPIELYSNPIVLNGRVLTLAQMRALLLRFGAGEHVLAAFNRHTWNRRISLAAAEN